ncbi:MAG: acylneuraminate cytidylyltransferase [Oscillochloris sp.]|nr:acylneuraminate cytidylyltransferase [Oscillochloris sp.]
MHILAIIPARGGSKGLPRKNIRPLAGKPLIAHMIEQACAARLVSRVVVSTDDLEIAAVSQQYGAEVIWRPVAISGDTASSEAALIDALDQLERAEGYAPELIVFLQCTSPLTRAEDIDGTVRALLDAQADTALAVTPFHYFLWQMDAQGQAVGINHDKRVRLMRQQRTPQYRETGAVYVMRTAGFRQFSHRFFGATAMYRMPTERCHEIDDIADFAVAEALFEAQRRQQQPEPALPTQIGAVVFDFDGVFTDNRVIVDQDGRESVVCDRGDGMGLSRLRQRGIPMLVLSTETNPVVQARCTKLQIPCRQGLRQKLPVLLAWLDEQQIDLAHTIYVGNDINDIECLRAVGCGVIVADAHPQTRSAARIVLTTAGGRGAIRELTDMIEQHLRENSDAPRS